MNIINNNINDFINKLFSKIFEWFGYEYKVSASASFIFIIAGIVLIILLFASAFLASQYAEKDKKNRFFHFIAGLIIPWIYPLVIYQLFRPKRKAAEVEVEQVTELSKYQKMAKEFTAIASDEQGNPRGPFLFELTSNKRVKVNQILEIRENLLIVSMTLGSGEAKKIRIPFDQVKAYSNI